MAETIVIVIHMTNDVLLVNYMQTAKILLILLIIIDFKLSDYYYYVYVFSFINFVFQRTLARS